MGPDRTVTGERWPALDAARGVAIAAMVIYHLAWDLSFVRLIATIGHGFGTTRWAFGTSERPIGIIIGRHATTRVASARIL